MLGRMVWWESAAAPKKGGAAIEVRRKTRGRQKSKRLKKNELLVRSVSPIAPAEFGWRSSLGSFGRRSSLGLFGRRSRSGSFGSPIAPGSFGRAATRFSDGSAATGPRLNGRWEFYPISVALTTAI